MTTGILLLAAGGSRRFGSDKRFARLVDGRELLRASVESARASGLPVLVCLRPQDEPAQALLRDLGVAWLDCPNARLGMGHTIADACASLPDWQGLLLALADMPAVAEASYRAVAQALDSDSIVQPCYRGQGGHPVGFGSHFWPRLRELQGDRGARDLLRDNAAALRRLALDDAGILLDIDTPADSV